MTNNTRAVLKKVERKKIGLWNEASNRKVFLGCFVYAEFLNDHVRLTDEDGCGRVLDSIMLNKEQFHKLVEERQGLYEGN